MSVTKFSTFSTIKQLNNLLNTAQLKTYSGNILKVLLLRILISD